MLFADINTHLLPDIGDGVNSFDESIELVRNLSSQGVQCVMVTPDNRDIAERVGIEAAERSMSTLRRLVSEHEETFASHMRLRFGMEHHLEPDLPSLLVNGDARPIQGTRFIIVKLPFGDVPEYAADVLDQLTITNVQPIIAHPERNEALQRNWQLLSGWVEKFNFVQVSAGSLLGNHGGHARSAAERFIQRGLVHVIASEARSRHDRPGETVTEAHAVVSEIVGERRANVLFYDNSESVFRGVAPRNVADGSSVSRRARLARQTISWARGTASGLSNPRTASSTGDSAHQP